jgi:hypothetical protein
MEFKSRDYVPVLKLKPGEKAALTLVPEPMRTRIVPCLEVVERTDKDLPAHLDRAFSKLAESLRGYARCLLDARELAGDGQGAAEEVFKRAAAEGIDFTPVTGIERGFDTAPALDYLDNGLAIRLTRRELEGGLLPGRLRQFMSAHGIQPHDVDLILDLGPIETLVAPGIIALTEAFLRATPDHTSWRTFTVSGCAFPQSMGGVGRNSFELMDRADWTAWRLGVFSQRTRIPRLPTYSDCAIQHPSGVEGFDPRLMSASAAIRYTLPEQWLLIKGQSTRTMAPSVQFPALATQLVYGPLRRYFAGDDHCPACSLMKAAADGAKGCGAPVVWRRLGTAHHIVQTIEGLDALP